MMYPSKQLHKHHHPNEDNHGASSSPKQINSPSFNQRPDLGQRNSDLQQKRIGHPQGVDHRLSRENSQGPFKIMEEEKEWDNND